MKKFVAAEIAELNINETANGIFDTWFESWFIHNDSDNHCKKPDPKQDTPVDDPVQNENS